MRPCGRIATSGVGGRNIFWRRPKGDFLTDGASESRKWRNPSLGGSTRSCREPGADGNSVKDEPIRDSTRRVRRWIPAYVGIGRRTARSGHLPHIPSISGGTSSEQSDEQ